MLCLWIFFARELEEGTAGITQRLLFVEATSFRPEIEHWAAAWAGCRQAEIHWHEFDPVTRCAHYETHIVNLDVIGSWQIQFAPSRRNAALKRLHRCAVFGPANMLLIVFAHHSQCSADNRPPRGLDWASPFGTGLLAARKPRFAGLPPSGVHP